MSCEAFFSSPPVILLLATCTACCRYVVCFFFFSDVSSLRPASLLSSFCSRETVGKTRQPFVAVVYDVCTQAAYEEFWALGGFSEYKTVCIDIAGRLIVWKLLHEPAFVFLYNSVVLCPLVFSLSRQACSGCVAHTSAARNA